LKITYGDWEQVAAGRITDAMAALRPVRDKSYELRKLVAGDSSVVGGVASEKESDTRGESPGEWADFFMSSVVSGRSNRLLEAVKTLSMQTAHRFPEIEFEDLEPEQAAINAGACKYLLGPAPKGCSAQDHIRASMMDYLIDGSGWSELSFDSLTKQPVIRAADSLDCTWEPGCPLFDLPWASIRKRETLGFWMEFFGPKKVREFMARFQASKGSDFDKVVELEFYYDRDGFKGRGMHYVFERTSRTSINPKPVMKTENPWYWQGPNKVKPFLPLTTCYYLRLPSMRNPISVVEMMLADQLAIWKDEDRWDKIIERMRQFWAVRKGSLSDEAREAFEKGDEGAIVEYGEDGQPPTLSQAGEPPNGLQTDRDYHERRIVSMGGVDPYASGGPIQGVEYASEVNAIRSSSGLTASSITADSNAFWISNVWKLLCALSVYGDNVEVPVRFDGVTWQYGPNKSIRERIDPDADISIREDATVFKSREQKINEALRDIQVASQPAILQMFPNALSKSYQSYLVAKGETNLKAFTESPGMDQMAAQVGAQTPQAMAESSTGGI
jgi:hypothetical protein